ncbi:uncharacterized protein V1513DRAFT_436987 [Lipomyces chichibuensis]|uniref:uncharacterized protein n=1 Tax=Lipomyces chichibuensis TaxID=1546026 RepID=UPI003343B59E
MWGPQPGYMITIFVTGMLITGCSNSLLTKFQDNQCVANCNGPVSDRRYFEQPVIQTFQMFIAEACCWGIVFLQQLYSSYSRPARLVATADTSRESVEPDASEEPELLLSTDPNISLLSSAPTDSTKPMQPMLDGNRVFGLSIPAFCDICGTTLMNVGLFFTPVSIYQMTRGALVLFVGLFSVIFLGRRLELRQWTSLGVVVLGVFIVGLSGVIYAPDTTPKDALSDDTMREPNSFLQVAFGVFIIALAQIFTATQFVYEEHILQDYHLDSMRVVGWEGIFGFLLTGLIMIVAYVFVGHTDAGRGGYFDIPSGAAQIAGNPAVFLSSLLIMLSIGAFNFFGISVTQKISATSRSTIDTCRTLGIWLISILLGWEQFRALQLIGFGLLVYGTLVFNGVLSPYVLKKFDSGRIRLADEEE